MYRGDRLPCGQRLSLTPVRVAPSTVSYATQPNAHTSVRRSTVSPSACSGLMSAAVPNRTPLAVAAVVTVGQHFQGHIPAELRVPGAVHLTHAALADEGGDFVRAEARAWADGHVGYGNGGAILPPVGLRKA